MNSKEMEAWLNRIPHIVELRGEPERALQEALGSPALTALLGLIYATRQGLYAQLSHLPNGDVTMSHRVSVLQGKIQGLEMVVQTVRELGVPSSASDKAIERN